MALLEPSLAACIHAKQRGLQTIICGTLTEDTVKDASIKQLTLLDVLEHIEQDDAFLKLLWKKNGNGWRILLTVPAFPLLWSSIDDSGGHYRRYRVNDLKNLVREAGFEVLYINYFFEFLFSPFFWDALDLKKSDY